MTELQDRYAEWCLTAETSQAQQRESGSHVPTR